MSYLHLRLVGAWAAPDSDVCSWSAAPVRADRYLSLSLCTSTAELLRGRHVG